jgi:hypothetical protein
MRRVAIPPRTHPSASTAPRTFTLHVFQPDPRGCKRYVLIPCFVQSDIPVETVPIPCSRLKSSLIPEKQGTDIFINFISILQVMLCQVFG